MKRPPLNQRVSRRPGGFALIVTLSIMILLVVIGVGMLSLSVISLRRSTAGEARQVAEANARMALILALGRLQAAAGPDQRATGAADMAPMPSGSGGSPGPVRAGLVQPKSGTRFWTGVWKNTQVPKKIFTQNPTPELVDWLVSGGEEKPIGPDHAAISMNRDGTTSDPETTVVLVGQGSAGTSAAAADSYVAVPLLDVKNPRDELIGRYGWWVGDEGVKTRLNLPTPSENEIVTAANIGSRGGGWEVVSGFGDYPNPGAGDESTLGRVLTVSAAALADPNLVGANSALKLAFHDTTADSRGLLTNQHYGGLKLDLTRYLEDGFPDQPANPAIETASKTGNIIPISVARERGLRWEKMRNFAKLREKVSGGTLEVRPATDDDELTIAPVILDFRLLFGAQFVAASGDQYKIYPCAKVAVALANPYPHTLKWDSELEFEVFNESPPGNLPSRIFDAVGQPAFIPSSGRGGKSGGEAAVFNHTIFTIPAGSLAPGEALAWTMASPVQRPAGHTSELKVALSPFSRANPGNFENCIIMAHNSLNPAAERQIDVRESWTTSLISVELRHSGSEFRRTPILRKVDRIELDNGFFSEARRPASYRWATLVKQPFPLQIFSFQLSQPGADYASILPSRRLGLRNSTLRTFQDFNLQGQTFVRPIAGYLPPPYFMESTDSLSQLPPFPTAGQTGPSFTRNLALSPLSWGFANNTGPKSVILFSPPQEMVSLAQFQHADLTADDRGPSIGHQPGNAVGNSYYSPFVKRALSSQRRKDYVVIGSPNPSAVQGDVRTYFDQSYLLNSVLWDTYFLSTIGTGQTPGNQRIAANPRILEIVPGRASGELRDATLAAKHLWVEGAFNVNSTRKDAWLALFATSRTLKLPVDLGDADGTMFPRSLDQTAPAASDLPSGNGDDSWSGFRRLTNQQLEDLAEEMIRQVRLRGPFTSLSQFVNRSLVDIKNDPEHLGRSGALQQAIDESGLNLSPNRNDSGFRRLNAGRDRVTLLSDGKLPAADMTGSDPSVFREDPADEYPVWAPQSRDDNPGNTASILADRPMLLESKLRPEQGFRSTNIPGWLSQADVLQVIGPVLSARSDTFRIRAYGEAVDKSGVIRGRAWCEAIVQRTPSYVDPTDSADRRDTELTSINARFGRRFDIVGFRWLSADEI